MASATSKISKVQTFTGNKQQRRSGKGPRETAFYKTEVTTLADGGVKRETYRTDAKGNNSVKISDTTVDKDGNVTAQSVTSNATGAEKKALQDPNSRLSNTIKQQTKDAGDKARANSTDPGGDKAIDKAGGGSGNDSNDDPQGDSQTADTTDDRANNRDFGDMLYPQDMAENQDVIQFTALKYEAKTIQGFAFNGRERVTPGAGGPRSVGTVTLPIQSGIKDNSSAGWGEDSMNPLQMAMAGAALGGITGGIKGFGDQTGKMLEQFKEGSENFKTATTGIFAAKAAGVQNLLARTEGKIINPNLELLFQKPSLRPFSFQFRLAARSKDEADEIIKIIRFFKQNMAPQKGGGSGGPSANLFLLAPNTFQVHYLYRGGGDGSGDEHKYIGKVKECAITNFEVDYTPDGNYSTLKDGFMTSYTIAITMKELEPVFYEDYENLADDEIGF